LRREEQILDPAHKIRLKEKVILHNFGVRNSVSLVFVYLTYVCTHADKKSRHLGSDGVYLDDIKDLKPEVAALYFPKRFVIPISPVLTL